jgi:acyl-coenzyme A synthetase/AMP-(fatty) acid ligase
VTLCGPCRSGRSGAPTLTGRQLCVLGIYPVIYDEDGNDVDAGSGGAGNICIRNPWPGIVQTIWGQPERFVEVSYEKYCRKRGSTDWRDWPYFAGDGAVQAADGYFRILGRVHDVINVAGHRLGTKELVGPCPHGCPHAAPKTPTAPFARGPVSPPDLCAR